MSANGLGYVVAVINQASGQPETLTCDYIHDRVWAEQLAEDHREETAEIGRREQYVVCELVPVDGA